MLYGVACVLRSYSLEHDLERSSSPYYEHTGMWSTKYSKSSGHIEWEKEKVKGEEAVEAHTQVQGGHPQQGVQEEAQGQPTPRLALRRPLGGLRHKNSVLHTQVLEAKTTCRETGRGGGPSPADSSPEPNKHS